MSYKNIDEQKQAQHDWYLKNKEIVAERRDKRRKEAKDYVETIRHDNICTDCGLKGSEFPECISFHHLNPKEKDKSLSQMAKYGYGKDRIDAEISLCIPVCENCHRKRHYAIDQLPNTRSKERLAKVKYIKKKKMEIGCCVCGESDWRCLEFAYIDKKDGDKYISKMVFNDSSYEDIDEAISRSKVICINCWSIENSKVHILESHNENIMAYGREVMHQSDKLDDSDSSSDTPTISHGRVA